MTHHHSFSQCTHSSHLKTAPGAWFLRTQNSTWCLVLSKHHSAFSHKLLVRKSISHKQQTDFLTSSKLTCSREFLGRSRVLFLKNSTGCTAAGVCFSKPVPGAWFLRLYRCSRCLHCWRSGAHTRCRVALLPAPHSYFPVLHTFQLY